MYIYIYIYIYTHMYMHTNIDIYIIHHASCITMCVYKYIYRPACPPPSRQHPHSLPSCIRLALARRLLTSRLTGMQIFIMSHVYHFDSHTDMYDVYHFDTHTDIYMVYDLHRYHVWLICMTSITLIRKRTCMTRITLIRKRTCMACMTCIDIIHDSDI